MNEQEAKAVVLEYLTSEASPYNYPFVAIGLIGINNLGDVPREVKIAYLDLPTRTHFELLAEFAEWGLKGSAKG